MKMPFAKCLPFGIHLLVLIIAWFDYSKTLYCPQLGNCKTKLSSYSDNTAMNNALNVIQYSTAEEDTNITVFPFTIDSKLILPNLIVNACNGIGNIYFLIDVLLIIFMQYPSISYYCAGCPLAKFPFILQYIPRNMHTVLLCFALLWLYNRS